MEIDDLGTKPGLLFCVWFVVVVVFGIDVVGGVGVVFGIVVVVGVWS